MSEQRPTDELAGLLGRLLDDELDDSERRRLEALLREDATARARYHRYVKLHALLQWQIGDAAAYDSSAPVGTADRRSLLYRRRRLISLICAAVSVLLVIGVLAAVYLPKGQRGEHAFGAPSNYAAQLNAVHQARWSDASESVPKGRRFKIGEHVELTSGLAELRFKDGTIVTLKGPARLEFLAADNARLRTGAVRVRLEQASSFALDVPRGRIVDLGTEFGARVDENEATHVYVFSGAVAASLVGEDGQSDETVRLQAGSSAVVRPTEQSIVRDVADESSLFADLKVPVHAAVRVANASFEIPQTRTNTRDREGWHGSKETGVFDNDAGHGHPLENVHGRQLAYMNTKPGNELYQDTVSRYLTGHSYELTVAIAARSDRPEGAGAIMEARLFYRDTANKPVVVAAKVVDYDSLHDNRLSDFSIVLPAVKSTDSWQGQQIGIWFASISGGNGDWTLDDVRLTAIPTDTRSAKLQP